MDYGALVSRSWSLTWRHRFLWILGLFAGGGVGSCSSGAGGGSGGGGGEGRFDPPVGGIDTGATSLESFLRQIAFALNMDVDVLTGAIVVAALLVVSIGLVLLVVSIVCQGAIARATVDISLGRTISLGQAWRAGTATFWRYVVLGLLLAAAATGIAVLLGGGALVAGILIRVSDGAARAVFVAIAVLVGAAIAILGLLLLLLLGVVVGFAQRAIALEGTGATAGLSTGFNLVRHHLGASFVAWLLSLALGFAFGIGGLMVGGVVAVPLGLGGWILYSSLGISLVTILYAIAAGLLFLAVVLAMVAASNSYFWNYWTLVYLRFQGMLTDRLEPAAE